MSYDLYAPRDLCAPTVNGESNPLFHNLVLEYVAFSQRKVLSDEQYRIFPKLADDQLSFEDLYGFAKIGCLLPRLKYLIRVDAATAASTAVPKELPGALYEEDGEQWVHSWKSWAGDEAREDGDFLQIPCTCGSTEEEPGVDVFITLYEQEGITLLPWNTPDPRRESPEGV